MPLHSSRPTNSEIFAQKARERAMEVLALRNDDFPGLMRTDPPPPTFASRLRKSRTLIIAVSIAVIVLIATTATTGSSSNKEAVANNLRTGEKNTLFMGEDFEDASEDETQTSTGTVAPTESEDESDDEDFCIDDPDYRYFGNEEHDCAWVGEKHTANRCNHIKVMEHCRATCDPDCIGSNTFTPTSTLTDVETETPTSTSTDPVEDDYVPGQCMDNPNFRFEDVDDQDCYWVGEKFISYRCSESGVSENCPATCNPNCNPTSSAMTNPQEEEEEPKEEWSGDACTNNPNFRFEDVDDQDCYWVGEKFTSYRCSESGVSENCPAICDPDCNPASEESKQEPVQEESKQEPKEAVSQPVSEDPVEDELKEEESKPVSEESKQEPVEDEPKQEESKQEESKPVSHVEFHQDGCTNNPNFRFEGEPEQSCEWVGQKFTSYRCSESEVSVNCPATCDPDCGTLPPSSTSTSTSTSTFTSTLTSTSTSALTSEIISDEMLISV